MKKNNIFSRLLFASFILFLERIKNTYPKEQIMIEYGYSEEDYHQELQRKASERMSFGISLLLMFWTTWPELFLRIYFYYIGMVSYRSIYFIFIMVMLWPVVYYLIKRYVKKKNYFAEEMSTFIITPESLKKKSWKMALVAVITVFMGFATGLISNYILSQFNVR